MDRNKCHQIREKLQRVLDTHLKEMGLAIKLGSGNFTSTSFTIKVEFCEKVGGVVMTKERKNYELHAQFYGLPADGLGRRFVFAGEEFQVTGLSPSAHRFPVCCTRTRDGKTFRLSADSVKHGLAK